MNTLDMAKAYIVLVQMAYLSNRRSLTMLAAQRFFIYTPVMNKIFHTAPPGGESWLRIVGVAAIVFVVVEIEKRMRYGHGHGYHAVPE